MNIDIDDNIIKDNGLREWYDKLSSLEKNELICYLITKTTYHYSEKIIKQGYTDYDQSVADQAQILSNYVCQLYSLLINDNFELVNQLFYYLWSNKLL